MKLETLKEKLGEWFWPRSTAVDELMVDIRAASDELKKERQKKWKQEQLNKQACYYYRAKYGFQVKSGVIAIPLCYSMDGDLYPYTPLKILERIKSEIAWDTDWDILYKEGELKQYLDKIEILTLCPLETML